MSEGTPCPSCGSKRTTEMAGSDGRVVSIWCHACGAVTARVDEQDTRRAVTEAERLLAAQG